MQDLGLAVRALHTLQTGPGRPQSSQPVQLILAGGYDSRLLENKEVFEDLKRLVACLGVDHQVGPASVSVDGM